MKINLPCHIELMSTNMDETANFYKALFGWSFIDSGIQGYRLIKFSEDFPMGGAIFEGKGNVMSEMRWPLMYIRTDNIDEAILKAQRMGARLIREKTVITNRGAYAVFLDPDGNLMGLWHEYK